MARSVTLSLPPFTRTIKTLIAINAGIFLFRLLLPMLHLGSVEDFIESYFYLTARDVVHGHIYQLVTYGFLHAGFLHLFFNMLMLWMFGSMLEVPWGSRKFWEFYLFGIVGAALARWPSPTRWAPDSPEPAHADGLAHPADLCDSYGNRDAVW